MVSVVYAPNMNQGSPRPAGASAAPDARSPGGDRAVPRSRATFNERFPADQTSTQPSLEIPETKKEQNATTTTRVVSAKHPRSRVVVAPRSFLDAGRQVLPGERKFLDYAFSPTHVALEVVTNTGGRVGWHNSPLPGPFFPQ